MRHSPFGAAPSAIVQTPTLCYRRDSAALHASESDLVDLQAPSLFVVENHDEALHVWRRVVHAKRILVHVDAHHDMAWLESEDQLDIGNYVCEAVKAGLVREVVWVVPSASWDSRHGRAVIRRHLKTLAHRYEARDASIRSQHRQMFTRLLGAQVRVCALDTLGDFNEPVLLDIDTDFMTLRIVEYSRDDRPGRLPWIWPEELAAALGALQPDVVTIAYSVAGGYTPLKWKYLGDHLATVWAARSPASESSQAGFRAIQEAAIRADRGEVLRAAELLTQARAHLPCSAAPCYHLARLLMTTDPHAARRHFTEAVQLDPTYDTPYSGRGFVCLREGRVMEAETEFEEVLALDPENAVAKLGRAQVCLAQGQWRQAEQILQSLVTSCPRSVDVYRCLADALVELGREAEAEFAYSRSLKLALQGEVSVDEPIRTVPRASGPQDVHHGRIYAALAAIDEHRGHSTAAIAGYRLAIAAGARGRVRRRLAGLLFRRGEWLNGAREIRNAIMQAPAELRRWWLDGVWQLDRWYLGIVEQRSRTKKKPRSAMKRIEAGEK